MRRFQLTLDEETFDEFQRYFFGHGIRQTVLRQAVKELIKKAKLREVKTGEIIMDIDDLMTLED
jgi:hypothetical protein